MNDTREIGGYFELELAQKNQYYVDAIKLNSGRNAFEYILKSQSVTKVFIPNFICNSIIEPLTKLSLQYEFYNIDEKFEISKKIKLKKNEKLLYVNYFSLKSKYIEILSDLYKDNLIVDNTQAFFDSPINNIDTFYSPRKYFGVSDGAYLFTNKNLNEKLSRDESFAYTLHLIGRLDKGASSFYNEFLLSENRCKEQPIKIMSNFTERMLCSIDYEYVKNTRLRNYFFIHSRLKEINLFNIEMLPGHIPFVYPFMTNSNNLRDILITNKIFIARYWDEVLERESVSSIEKEYVNKLLPLPIDQRYDLRAMEKIVSIIKSSIT